MAEGSLSLSSQNLIARVAAPVVGCLFAFVLGMMLVNDRENALASFMSILGFAGFFAGAISPRLGLYSLIFLCAYLDFIKRLLILFGDANMDDVIQVLRVAPLVLAGTLSGLIVAYAFKRFQLKRLEWILLGMIAVIEAAVIASSVRSGGGLAEAANVGVYVPLIIIIPLVFRTIEEMLGFCRMILAVFLPVALYGIWQGFFGLADFEYQYMLTGLTSIAFAMDDAYFRPFSTLSSPQAFQVTTSVCALLAATLTLRSLRGESSLWNTARRFVLPITYFAASIISLGRGGWCVWIFGGIGFYAFKTGKSTATFYGAVSLALGLVIANAKLIFENLDNLQAYLPADSSFGQRAFTLGTYSERLYGFMNLFDNSNEMISWFGNPSAQYATGALDYRESVVHDALGQLIVNYGIVGLLVVLTIAGMFLFWAHRYTLNLSSVRTRLFSTALLSVVLGILISGLIGGSTIGMFPINFLFWSMTGMIVAIGTTEEGKRKPGLEPGIVRPRHQRWSAAPSLAHGQAHSAA